MENYEKLQNRALQLTDAGTAITPSNLAILGDVLDTFDVQAQGYLQKWECLKFRAVIESRISAVTCIATVDYFDVKVGDELVILGTLEGSKEQLPVYICVKRNASKEHYMYSIEVK